MRKFDSIVDRQKRYFFLGIKCNIWKVISEILCLYCRENKKKLEGKGVEEMKLRVPIIAAVVTFGVLGGVAGATYYNHTAELNQELDTYVLPNTTFAGIPLNGKTREEVAQIIQAKVDELNKTQVTLDLNGKKQSFTWGELGVTYEGTDIVDTIFNGQQGSYSDRVDMKEEAESGVRAKTYELTQVFSPEKYDEVLESHYNKPLTQPKNASVYMAGSQKQITPGKNGAAVDKDKLKELVATAVVEKQPSVTVPTKEIAPKRSTEDVQKMNFSSKVMSYQTPLKGREANTRFNVELATKGIDGTLLEPGEVFSFKDVVGHANKANGYKESTVYVNGELAKDYGGGICQVSSTLYNAVLLADLGIVERVNHSRTVGYVPIGLDATVADYGPDFKFKNTLDTPIYVQAYLTGDAMVVNLLGAAPIDKQVVLSSKVDSETDTHIKASAYKTVKQNGKVISENQLIGKSTYKKSKPATQQASQ
jgi:vancomycin resistance protein YoaR